MNSKLLFHCAVLSLLVACGGETEEPTPDCNTSDLALMLSNSTPASCGADDGQLQVSASGGAGEYQFSIDNTNFQSSGTFDELAASNYTITVKDANDCTKTLSVNVESSAGISLEIESEDAGCGTSAGALMLSASGGVEPYEFKIGNGSYSMTSTFTGLESGNYSVTARDAEGCEVSQEVRLESGISFNQSISTIIETNCAISGCHSGTQAPNFTMFSNIQENAGLIKSKTADRSMPKDGSLTEEEIAAIACWVDDGAKNN